jgi:hypothetical protein
MKMTLIVIVSVMALACSPATISRIGPTLTPREPDCDVEVLPPGEKPTNAHRDIGMVSLQNCQEYHVNPCRKWLTDAVCQMGGHVAYLPDPIPPRNEFDAVNYRVMVAVYVISGPPDDEGVCKEPSEPDPEVGECE